MNNDKSGRAKPTFLAALSAAAVLIVAGILAGYQLDKYLNPPVFASSTEARSGTSQHQCAATTCKDGEACP